MKSVRVQPALMNMLKIDIVCNCGKNGLKDEELGINSYGHVILIGATTTQEKTRSFICTCGQKYSVVSHGDHIHINEVEEKSAADPAQKINTEA